MKYIVLEPSKRDLKNILDHAADIKLDYYIKEKIGRELSVKQIADKIENDKWCVFPITSRPSEVKPYFDFGMKPVFVMKYFRAFKKEYASYMGE